MAGKNVIFGSKKPKSDRLLGGLDFFCEFLCFFVAMRLFCRKEAQKGAKKKSRRNCCG